MSTVLTCDVFCKDVEDLLALGNKLGKNLRGGEVIELIGDVGAGKTTLVRGVATGAKTPDRVSSPSFTISNVYECAKFNIYHFDFYRLHDAGTIANELADVDSETSVIILEWASPVEDVLPNERLKVNLLYQESGRKLQLLIPSNMTYLREGVC